MSRNERDELVLLRAENARLSAENARLEAEVALAADQLKTATAAPPGAVRRLLGYVWYPDGSMALDEVTVAGREIAGTRQLHPKDWPNVVLGVAERWNDHWRYGSQTEEFVP